MNIQFPPNSNYLSVRMQAVSMAQQTENSDLVEPEKTVKGVPTKAKAVSFGTSVASLLGKVAKDGDVLALQLGLKKIVNLPCAYCGHPMIIRTLSDNIVSNFAPLTGENLTSNLERLFLYLPESRHEVIKMIIEKAKENPQEQIDLLVNRMAFPIRNRYVKQQKRRLKEIRQTYLRYYPEEDREKFSNFINQMKETVWTDIKERDTIFHPSVFLQKFLELLPRSIFNNLSGKLEKEFYSDVEKLGFIDNAVEAFLLRNINASANTILRSVISGSTATIEHIKPRSAGGLDSLNNITAVCKSCNTKRLNKPLSEFVDAQPKILPSILKQFHYIRTFFGNKLDTYISEVSKGFMTESQGKLDLSEFVK